jgi:hypothetical protein
VDGADLAVWQNEFAEDALGAVAEAVQAPIKNVQAATVRVEPRALESFAVTGLQREEASTEASDDAVLDQPVVENGHGPVTGNVRFGDLSLTSTPTLPLKGHLSYEHAAAWEQAFSELGSALRGGRVLSRRR